MVNFERTILDNGLVVIAHVDKSNPLAALSIGYDVGSRDESPDRTGFAHLFEHLMFGGSQNIPNFDDAIQMAGGESNAFTNSDWTNFHEILPAQNIETAFWLESDRMANLVLDSRSLEIQQKVVVEEFKETCLNSPYGDAWHRVSELTYEKHPYRWPTIGMKPQHIEEATLKDVGSFFRKHYCPSNAVLVVASPLPAQKVFDLAEKWFGEIKGGGKTKHPNIVEPIQNTHKRQRIQGNVPLDALYMSFHMPKRLDPSFYTLDLLTDVLASGKSSRFYQNLVRDKALFAEVDAYITGTTDPGLVVIEGRLAEGVSFKTAEASIWEELDILKEKDIEHRELQLHKNQVESHLLFSEVGVMNKAINLTYYELLGNASLVNEEGLSYQAVTANQIWSAATSLLVKPNCCVIEYEKR